jgi:serine protease Do
MSVMLARLVASALGAASFLAASAAFALDPTQIASQAKPSVVLVSLFDAGGSRGGSGSGFFVDASGKLVTNHHVIEEAAQATVTLSDGRELPVVGILVDDAEHDIAVVQVAGGGTPFVPLALGDTTALHPGDEIAVIGSPLGLSTTVSTGIVSAVRGEGLAKENGFEKDHTGRTRAWGLQVTAPIAPGSSGSPILDGQGHVVGVAVGELLGGQNLNFGVATSHVKAALAKSEGAVPRPLSAAPERTRNLLISALALALGVAAYFVIPVVVARRAKRRAVGRGRIRSRT